MDDKKIFKKKQNLSEETKVKFKNITLYMQYTIQYIMYANITIM